MPRSLRFAASVGGFGFLTLVAVILQLGDNIPIHAEFGPIENAEIGLVVLVAALALWIVFIAEDISSARWLLLAAAASLAAPAVKDLVGLTLDGLAQNPFGDLPAAFSLLGAALLVLATMRITGAPPGALLLLGVGLFLQITDFALDAGAPALGRAIRAETLADVAELSEIVSFATCAAGMTLLGWTAIASPGRRVFARTGSADVAAHWPWLLEMVTACDLCGSGDLQEVCGTSATSCRTVMCRDCGLLFASPALPKASLDRFFELGFDGDPGAQRRVSRDDALDRKALREEQSARIWALPLITRHMELQGSRVLDLRSRTGTLARAMAEQGAEVTGLDPLVPNVARACAVEGLDNIRFQPISELAELRGIPDCTFDAVTALTVHILSHLPSPRRHLERVLAVLRPGGLLFLDEKHALRPARTAKSSLFGTRPVHSVHFTDDTIARYLRSVGFDIVECAVDRSRTSAFRHLRVVARKPVDGTKEERMPERVSATERERILAEIGDAQRSLERVRALNAARRSVKRLLRRFHA